MPYPNLSWENNKKQNTNGMPVLSWENDPPNPILPETKQPEATKPPKKQGLFSTPSNLSPEQVPIESIPTLKARAPEKTPASPQEKEKREYAQRLSEAQKIVTEIDSKYPILTKVLTPIRVVNRKLFGTAAEQIARKTGDTWIKEHPTINKILSPLDKAFRAYESTPLGKFNARTSETALDVMSAQEIKPDRTSTGSKVGDTAATVLGSIGGFVMSPNKGTSIGSALTKAGQPAEFAARKLLTKAPAVLPKIATKAAPVIARGATEGAAYGFGTGVAQGKSTGEAVKQAGTDALFGVALDPLIVLGIPALGSKLLSGVQRAIGKYKGVKVDTDTIAKDVAKDIGVDWASMNDTQRAAIRKVVQNMQPEPVRGGKLLNSGQDFTMRDMTADDMRRSMYGERQLALPAAKAPARAANDVLALPSGQEFTMAEPYIAKTQIRKTEFERQPVKKLSQEQRLLPTGQDFVLQGEPYQAKTSIAKTDFGQAAAQETPLQFKTQIPSQIDKTPIPPTGFKQRMAVPKIYDKTPQPTGTLETQIPLNNLPKVYDKHAFTGKKGILADLDEVMARGRAKDKGVLADLDEAMGKNRTPAGMGNITNSKASIAENVQDLIKNSDQWKDKGHPLSYKNETWDRNIIDIAGKEDGERIREYIFKPIHKNEALSNKLKNTMRERIKSLNLSQKESEAVQKFGEGKYVTVEKIQDALTGKKIEAKTDHLYTLDDLKEEFPDSWQKIVRATGEFRKIYDGLIEMANETLVRNGYKPIGKLKDYFPHFQGEDPIMKALGIKIDVQDLPTDINGLTAQFRPGKNWFGHFLHRTGEKTTLDAVEGFDRYVEGISKVIHHTDDIQRLRAFNRAIRTKYSSEEIQKQIQSIWDNNTLSKAQKEALTEELAGSGTHLSNAVADLTEYTNVLAGKKDIADRSVESLFKRSIYNASNFLINRIGKGMVAINPGTWLTQFIPITQVAAVTSKKNLKRALDDTMKNLVNNDGFHDRSVFMTNRIGSEALSKSTVDKVGDALSSPMKWIDRFSANVVTRSRYLDGIDKGMSPEKAMEYADDWAAKIMGDRSAGAQPTLYNQRNPITRMLVQFQLEVNNQLKVITKDIPREYQNNPNAKKMIASAVGQLALYGFLYNQIFEMITGRRPALDPIGVAFDFGEDASNKNIRTSDAVGNLGKNVLNQLPYASTFLGGGRVPISSALPNLTNINKYTSAKIDGDISTAEAAKGIGKELLWPAAYLALPFGAGQLKKTVQGLGAVNKGGEYGKTAKGEKYLKFPIKQSVGNKIKAGIFGKSALPETEEYYRNKTKSLGTQQTQAFDYATAQGVNPQKMYKIILDMRELEPTGARKGVTDQQKIEVINKTDLPQNQKILLKKLFVKTEQGKRLLQPPPLKQ